MDRTRISLAVMIVAVSLAATWVAADFNPSHTPLYTFRMEQLSNNMGFLPTRIREFTYTAEHGCYQHCNLQKNDSGISYITNEVTCFPPTCDITCPPTCFTTCDDPTCLTCIHTCPETCPDTCLPTCPDTCEHTCRYTCTKPCQP